MSIAGKDELSAWRGHPVTELIRQAMDIRIQTYLRAIPQYLVKNKTDEARAATGALNAYEELYAELFSDAPAEKADEGEDDYRDPAARSQKET